MKNDWNRFVIIEKIIAMFFISNLFLDVLNNKILNSIIPTKIIGFLFFLSLGLFLGFKLCKYEYGRTLKKQKH